VLIDIFISLIVIFIFVFLYNKIYLYKNKLVTCFIIISISQTMLLYAFVVPTAIDRSLSIYLLEKLAQKEGVLPISDFNRIAKVDYFKDMDVVNTRIEEQIATGSLIIIGDDIILTDKGKFLNKVFHFVKENLLPK